MKIKLKGQSPPARQKASLSDAAFKKAEDTLIWWNGITKDPRFQDIIDAQKRRKRYAKTVSQVEHIQHFVGGHNAGFDEALDGLFDVHLNPQEPDHQDELQ